MRMLLAALCGCLVMQGWAAAATFEEANQLYERGKFAEAKAAYSTLPGSANREYNLGNTEFRLGQQGRAALHYERALALEPSHPEARTNLELVRRQSGARLFAPSLAERLLLPWPHSAYLLLLSGAFWSCVFGVATMLAWRRTESFAHWGFVLLTGGLAAYAAIDFSRSAAQASLGIVVTGESIARVAPADRAVGVEPLPAGTRVRILSERGAWTYCELPAGGRGWLPRTALEAVAG